MLKFIQYLAIVLVFTITFANFTNSAENFTHKNTSSFPINEIRNMNDEKLTEFLKNMQKSSTALFDKTRIAKAAAVGTGMLILEAIIFILINEKSGNRASASQTLSILALTPFGCYFAVDYLIDKITKLGNEKSQN